MSFTCDLSIEINFKITEISLETMISPVLLAYSTNMIRQYMYFRQHSQRTFTNTHRNFVYKKYLNYSTKVNVSQS